MNLITLHFWTYLALKQWDVNIVAHHLCKPKHHLIPQLEASNKVFVMLPSLALSKLLRQPILDR